MNTGRCLGMICLVLAGMLAACSRHDDGAEGEALLPKVTVLTALGGVGDNGYNDDILDGVMRFNAEGEVALSLISPESMNEAGTVLQSWLAEDEGTGRSLLVLASNDYASLLQSTVLNLNDRRQILLFESPAAALPAGVMTFRLRRYGGAYLSGCLARESAHAQVVAAYPDAPIVQDAVEGFCDGYADYSGKTAAVEYLAEDYTGYDMPDKAYRLAKNLDERTFIFPLAGGSNDGIYKYSRDVVFSLLLVAGMDVDCSAYSTRIPFSLVVSIGDIVQEYLEDWVAGKDIPPHREYGLQSGVDIVLSPTFYTDMLAWEDYYAAPLYWETAYETYLPTAKEKEEAFYENK